MPQSFINWGKSKGETLEFVKHKVLAKIQGWKQNLLSWAGKEVSIKTVAIAVPAYAMSCFKLPKKWCNGVNSAVSNFWWG